nr:hypothetical protein [uncultured Desulfobacter sp.]
MGKRIRTPYFTLIIWGTAFFLCLAPGNTYAWFHSDGNCEECPVFESPRSIESLSKTYVFMPNVPDAASEIRLYMTSSKNSYPASAGELEIDIPFNLLSTSVTNIQALLDRQVAANLRLKNLLEQYLAQQKKTTEMLKDLQIPYLEINETAKKAVPASDAKNLEPADALKKKIAEEILFQIDSKDKTALRDSQDFQSVPTGEKGRGNPASDLEKYKKSNFNDDYLTNPGRTGVYHEAYGQNTELPWIFSFVLELLQSLANNKIEILSWATVMAVVGIVGTIVVKR